MPNTLNEPRRALVVVAALATLAACGGGNQRSDAGETGEPRPPAVPVDGGTFPAVDGGGATDDGGLDAGSLDAGCSVRFIEQTRLSISGLKPTDLALADFDGDGVLDLVVIGDSSGSNVRLLRGADGGKFAPAMPAHRLSAATIQTADGGTRTMRAALKVTAGDLDGDGVKDLVVSGEYLERLRTLFSQRDGGFREGPALNVNDPFGFEPAVADLNGDGRADLVCINTRDGADELVAFTSAPDGGLERSFSLDAGRFGSSPAVGDFDGDGVVDLLATRLPTLTWWHEVGVHRGYGNGGFVSQPFITALRVDSLLTVRAADVDRDGRPDAILSGIRWWRDDEDLDFGYPWVHPLRNTGGAVFGQTFTALGTPYGSADPVVADFNRNATADFAAVGPGFGVAMWLDQRGAPQLVPLAGSPIALEAADLNGDGLTDLVTANRNTEDVAIVHARCD